MVTFWRLHEIVRYQPSAGLVREIQPGIWEEAALKGWLGPERFEELSKFPLILQVVTY